MASFQGSRLEGVPVAIKLFIMVGFYLISLIEQGNMVLQGAHLLPLMALGLDYAYKQETVKS